MATLTLNPGDDIQVDGHDAAGVNDLIRFNTGNYFSQNVSLTTNGLTFESVSGDRTDVRIYGGPQVTGFAVQGNGFWKAASGVNLNAVIDTFSHTGSSVVPRGTHRIMVTVDEAYYHHVAAITDLGQTAPFGRAGVFFYDYDADELWLAADPGAAIVVVANQNGAFYGPANDITLQNFSVGCYQIQAGAGMLGGGPNNVQGTGWDIDNVKAFSSHGVGVEWRGNNSILQNSLVTECGQQGVGCGTVNGVPGVYIDDITDFNNEISYNNVKGFNPGHEAGGSKYAWVTRFTSTHSYYHNNLGPGVWLDINCVDYSIWWTKVFENQGGGIVIEISGFGEIAENLVERNGGRWPNNAVGSWPSSPNGAWGTMAGIMIWESNGLYVWPNTTLQAPTGILIHDNVVDDNRGGIWHRMGTDRDGDSSNPTNIGAAAGAYHNTAIRVHNNNIWWDEAFWTTGEHNGQNDTNFGTLNFTGAAENYFRRNDYTLDGARPFVSAGYTWGGTVSFSQWQSIHGFDLTSEGAAAPAEPYGNIPSGLTLRPQRLDVGITIPAPSVIGIGSGDIAPGLLDVGVTLFAPAVSTVAPDHIRINTGGPTLVDTPVDWEADGSADVAPGSPDPVAHEYNEDPVGSFTISNYTGAIDRTSDPLVAEANPPENLFHTERYDSGVSSMRYVIRDRDPLLKYRVTLFGAENFAGITGPGQRVFDVLVNGNVIKAGWDLFDVGGTASYPVPIWATPWDASFSASLVEWTQFCTALAARGYTGVTINMMAHWVGDPLVNTIATGAPQVDTFSPFVFNAAFLTHVGAMIDICGAQGLEVALLPTWHTVTDAGQVTTANAQTVGAALGTAFASKQATWTRTIFGGDDETFRDTLWTNMAEGLLLGGFTGIVGFHNTTNTNQHFGAEWLEEYWYKTGHCVDGNATAVQTAIANAVAALTSTAADSFDEGFDDGFGGGATVPVGAGEPGYVGIEPDFCVDPAVVITGAEVGAEVNGAIAGGASFAVVNAVPWISWGDTSSAVIPATWGNGFAAVIGVFDEVDAALDVIGSSGAGLHVAAAVETVVFPNAAGDIEITTVNITQSALFNAIDVIAIDRLVSPALLDVGITLPAPALTIAGVTELFPDVLDVGITLPAPTVTRLDVEKVIQPNVFDAAPTLLAPTITVSEEVPVSTDLIFPLWADVVDPFDVTPTQPSSFSQSRSATFIIGEADTAPYLQVVLRNGRNEALDLSSGGLDATAVVFSMRNQANNELVIDKVAATATAAAVGEYEYRWTGADTADAGKFWGEFQVTLADGRIATFPNQVPKVDVTITGELA